MRMCSSNEFRTLLLAMLFCGALSATGLCTEMAREIPADQEASSCFSTVLNADFDGDSKPDVAIGRSHGLGYTIEIQLTTRLAKSYFSLPDRGVGTRIFAYDIDKDSYQDLIITSATSLLPIAVFLGDGKGHFREAKPWTFLPFGLDTPYNYETGKVPAGLVSLVPQTRFTFDGRPSQAGAIVLKAGDWILGKYGIPSAQHHPRGSKTRSPPFSSQF
jgi:hypothetical protein